MLNKLFKKQKLDPKSILPLNGKMSAIIFENKNIGLKRNLFYKISIPLKKFKFEENIEQTSLELEFISLNVKNWKDIENKTFKFPLNPKRGYVDASVYLGSEHILLDIKKIKFGKINKNNIEVEISGEINFNSSKFKNTPINIKTSVKYEEFFIDQGILKPVKTNLNKAKEIAKNFVDLSDFKKPKIQTTHFKVKIISFPVRE